VTNDFGGLAVQLASKNATAISTPDFLTVFTSGKPREQMMINSLHFCGSLEKKHFRIIYVEVNQAFRGRGFTAR